MENMEWIIELMFDDIKLMFNPVIERIISLIHKQLDKSHENGYDICAMMFLVVPNISVPIQPVTAVVRGAVQFGLEKEIIKTREQGDPIKRKRSDGRVLKFSRLAKRDIYVTRKDNATYCDEPGVELLDSWCVDIPNASKENRAYEYTLTFGKVEIEAIAQAKTEPSFIIPDEKGTAKNGQGYIGITCSYIDSKFNLYEVTLTVNYVRYPHTSQHIIESLEETLDEWKLREKTFTITTDNAANMKKAISDMDGIEWQGCTAHTLQLVIGKGLVPIFKKKYPNANRLDNNENLAEGKQEEYIDARGTAKYLQLINDVTTRWNSSKESTKSRTRMIVYSLTLLEEKI
ncbi:hypothetical protein GLOIN_2v1687662 [Rhizophagus irregularis DAOM 181602=DAOM 197198]|nr:hypothetical protein GLOIN_2v1687662 [Rhizophagus irregularis DAOM 181602=DAOM 197198]